MTFDEGGVTPLPGDDPPDLDVTKALDAGVELWFRRALLALARGHAVQGDAERASVLLGASERNAFALELDPEAVRKAENRCREILGPEDHERAKERGRGLDYESLIDLVSRSADVAGPPASRGVSSSSGAVPS